MRVTSPIRGKGQQAKDFAPCPLSLSPYKRLLLAPVLFCILGSTCWTAAENAAPSEVGSRLDGFTLVDTSGKTHSLRDYQGKIVLLVFWSFKCPVMLSYDRRIQELSEQFRDRGVVVLAIDSNADETPEAIRKNAENLALGYPVLLDSDGILAQKLGATQAPSVFILDRDFVVRFAGVVDNGRKPGERGREAYAEDALEAIVSARQVAVPESKGAGCTIKRRF
jgi:peroxiredoxin